MPLKLLRPLLDHQMNTTLNTTQTPMLSLEKVTLQLSLMELVLDQIKNLKRMEAHLLDPNLNLEKKEKMDSS